MNLVFLLAGILLVIGMIEKALHDRSLKSIPIRIHVNGTRGKSTTTRLIAAGLRSGGLRVIAKTTGTVPMITMEDGSEVPIRRRGPANIMEQVRTIRMARARRAHAVVLECMALHPENQWVSEHRMVKSTIGVITNVRPDHLDIIGPEIEDAAMALSATVPARGHLVTAEFRCLGIIAKRAERLGTRIHAVQGEDIGDETMRRFGYLNFKDNVAIALRVCELAGVDKDAALPGILEAMPDPGAARIRHTVHRGNSVVFINAFAANDPESTNMVWDTAKQHADAGLPIVAVMNNRSDRPQRIAELAPVVVHVHPDYVVLIGDMAWIARRVLLRAMPDVAVVDLGGRRSPESVMDALCSLDRVRSSGGALVFGYGNTKGAGQALWDYVGRKEELSA